MKSILHQLISSLSSPFQKAVHTAVTENSLGLTPELFEKEKKTGKINRITMNAFSALAVILFFGTNDMHAQLLTWNTFGNTGTETTEPSTTNNANISSAALNYTGSTVTPAANGNRFGGSSWGLATLNTAKYIQFTVTPNAGFSFTPTSFVFIWDFSGTGPSAITIRSSADGYVADLGAITGMTTSTSAFKTITLTGLTNVTAATTFRIYAYGASAAGGTGGFDCASSQNNVTLNGTTASTGSPAIAVSGTPLSAVNTTYGTASATPTSFNVSGTNMTEGILVSAPVGTGYEVSLSPGSGYGAAVTVGAAGTIISTPVYARLSATATVAGNPHAGNIACTSSGATTVNVATVSSTVAAKALTITGATAQSKTYDRTTAATITATPVGEVNSDGLSFTGGGTFNNFNVGISKPVTAALVLSGSNTSSYSFTQPTGLTADINVKDLTISGAAANNKQYDGNSSATLSGILTGVISPDDVNVDLVGSFDAPFVDANIPVTSSATLVGDASVDNYNLIQPTDLTADITKKILTVSGATAQNKVFDGNTDAVITGTLVGVINPDFVDFIGTGVFQNAGPGTNIPVTSTSTIEGDIDNYELAQPIGLTANISEEELLPQEITFDALADAIYGDANIALTATSDSSLAVTYTSSNTDVATIVPGALPDTYEVHIVSAGSTTITALQAGDLIYDSATPVPQNLNVLAKELTVDAAAANKVYDRTDAAVVTGTLIGVVGSDDVTFVGAGTFASADAGTGITVFPASSLDGEDAANYTLTESNLSADITPKPLAVTGATTSNKVYDGTIAATITGASLTGVIAPDVVTVEGGGTFASKNVGTGISVTPALTLNGAQAANYSITQPTVMPANITPLALTITGLSALDKVYDRTTPATLTGTPSLVGVVSPDDVDLSGTVTVTAFFNNKNVGVAKPVSVFGYALGGADMANYTLTQPAGLTATVTVYSLTIFSPVVANKIYDGTTAATISGTLIGTLGSDVVTLNGTGTFATPEVGNGISVTSTSTVGGTDGPNYIINPQPTGLTANITAAPTYLASQDFEVVPATPTLTFTTSDVGTSGANTGYTTGQTGPSATDSPATTNLFAGGARGYRYQGPSSGIGSRTLTFNTIDASSYTNVQVSFRVAGMSLGSNANGIDGTLGTTAILGASTPVDFALLEVSPDGGTTWYKQAIVNVTTANTNVRWSFAPTGSGSRVYAANNTYSSFTTTGTGAITSGTTAITTATVTSLPSVAALKIRITLETNAANESWIIDDVNVTGTFGAACTVPDAITDLSATNGSSSSVVSWTYGDCYDDAIVVASTAAFTGDVPTGDGSAYIVNSQSYTDALNSSFDGGKIVYKGSPNSATISSLTNGTTYNFKVFVRKGTNWTTGDMTTATPVEAQYFWDADGATTAATGGTGTWDSAATSNWRTPNDTGSLAPWVTNTVPLNATIAGTAGTITMPSTITTPVAPNLYINTTGYTIASTGTTTIAIPALNTVLADNVHLTFSPNINTGTPVSGAFNVGNINGGANSGITINAAQGTSNTISQRVNLFRNNSSITTPITIASAGGTGTATVAALVATATGTSLSGTATITNNTTIKTGLGATSGFDLTVNGVVSGSADVIFAAGPAGGAGSVNLNAANDYTGATLFNLTPNGVVKLGIDNALPTTTTLYMAYSSGNGGILDLNGHNQTVASLMLGAGSSTIRNNAVATDATLTVNGAASTIFAVPINDGTSKITFVKAGSGTLTLAPLAVSNAYTGGTIISDGILQLGGNSGTIADTCPITLNGGTLALPLFSDTVGTLNLNSFGIIDVADAMTPVDHTLTFANSSAVTWAGSSLVIQGWTGTAGQSNTAGGKIKFPAGGLTLGQLAKISFMGYSGTAIMLPSGEIVPPGPTLAVSGALDHGNACVGSAANYVEYTITNNGAAAAAVTVVSDNPEFVVSNDPTSVAGASTATYRVTFTPSATGVRNAAITISTTTPNNNGPIVSNITGTGNANVTYYADLDDDTYGDITQPVVSCTGAPIYLEHLAVSNSTDCDDSDETKYQSANLYTDADGDGWDAGTGQEPVCYGAEIPGGYSLTTLGTDCNDLVFSATNDCGTGAVVNLTMFIEAYYIGDHLMNSVEVNQSGEFDTPDPENVETMTVELHEAEFPYAVVDTATGMLHTDGSLSVTFTEAPTGSYYIAVKGSNIVQTWSAEPQAVSGTTALDYDFASSASQAYADNQAMMFDGPAAMLSGDVNQDEIVDFSDYSVWEAEFGAFGYIATDINGDGIVDFSDYSVWEASFVRLTYAAYPFE